MNYLAVEYRRVFCRKPQQLQSSNR